MSWKLFMNLTHNLIRHDSIRDGTFFAPHLGANSVTVELQVDASLQGNLILRKTGTLFAYHFFHFYSIKVALQEVLGHIRQLFLTDNSIRATRRPHLAS